MLFIGIDCDSYRTLDSNVSDSIHGIISGASATAHQYARIRRSKRLQFAVCQGSGYSICGSSGRPFAHSCRRTVPHCVSSVHPLGIAPYVIAVQFLAFLTVEGIDGVEDAIIGV